MKSPHKFLRKKAVKIEYPFIRTQEELIKFKKEQRYAKTDKEVSQKDTKGYLKRLHDLKTEAYKLIR